VCFTGLAGPSPSHPVGTRAVETLLSNCSASSAWSPVWDGTQEDRLSFRCCINHIGIGFQLRNPQQPVVDGGLILRGDAEPDVIEIEGSQAADFSYSRAGRVNRGLPADPLDSAGEYLYSLPQCDLSCGEDFLVVRGREAGEDAGPVMVRGYGGTL
jgi:hypothetical protein